MLPRSPTRCGSSTRCQTRSVTVIDVRAGLLSPTLRALRDVGFLDSVEKDQFSLVVFHILGARPSPPSMRSKTPPPFTERRQLFPGKELHQQHQLFRMGPSDALLLF